MKNPLFLFVFLAGSALLAPSRLFAAVETSPCGIYWNGRPESPVALDLSAVPMNRSWPGFQRPKSQTKRGRAVNVDLKDGRGRLELRFPKNRLDAAARALRIRPLSRAQKPTSRTDDALVFDFDRPERLVLEFPDVMEDLHVFVNEPFVAPTGANVRVFGPGRHDAGLIRPKSGETIVLEKGAHVRGAVLACGVKDVRVCGRGVLDSSEMVRTVSDNFVLTNLFGAIRRGEAAWNTNGTQFAAWAATNMTVEGVMLVDSPFWAMTLYECRGLRIENVKIVGQWRYNSDGIDICGGEDIVIRDSFVRSFDDCVVARAHGRRGPVDMTVENCDLWCDWGKNLEVWAAEGPCAIENVRFRNCRVLAFDYAPFDVTDWAGGDGVLIRDVTCENLEVDFVSPRWKAVNQTGTSERADVPFPREIRTDARLAQVNYWACDTWRTKADEERAMKWRIEFENIALRGVKFFGDVPPEVTIVVDDNPGPLVIRGLDFDGLPPQVKIVRPGM